MQCHEMRVPGLSLFSRKGSETSTSGRGEMEKEVIHSGHFMVSHFEAEAQDDEYEVAVPVPDIRDPDSTVPPNTDLQVFNVNKLHKTAPSGQLAIETSLTKLFQCMSLAYRQKLTSPKWNRFRGIRLRWKDKIRLNNVIWRCWHMQFIKKENTLICQFASPLDEGTHNKPEAVVLEGKYWKRKLAAVTAEYKRWRMFYRNKIMGWAHKDLPLTDMDVFDWQSQSTDSSQFGPMMVDEDYMELMSDTLFSTITSNQPFAFPDTREIAKGVSLADFIQPSLVQLQPNLDDFMDALEPFHDVFSSKLPPVPEDCAVPELSYRSSQSFPDLTLDTPSSALTGPPEVSPAPQPTYQSVVSYNEVLSEEEPSPDAKSTAFYHAKVTTPRLGYQADLPNSDTTPPYICPEPIPVTGTAIEARSGVTGRTYKYETDGSPFSGGKVQGSQPPPPQQQQQQQTPQQQQQAQHQPPQQSFKVPAGTPKPVVPFKPAQFQKISSSSPCSSTSKPQYGRLQQTTYDLAAASQDSLLPEPGTGSGKLMRDTSRSNSLPVVNKAEGFAVPKQQNVVNVKGRQRTKSGSSLIMIKSKPPPPLSTANSDPALNLSNALLAQLLTSSTTGVYSIGSVQEPVQTGQAILKSTNVPIMPSPPKGLHQKMLPIGQSNALIVTSPSTFQNYINAVRPSSSPDSVTESNAVQNLSRSPPDTSAQKPDTSPKSGTGSNEHRRVCHINAEQKRRYNIKNGFDVLHSLIPYLTLNPNAKLSKATMLQKGAEYIRQLQAERLKMQEDMEALKYQIDSLTASISNCQSLLPATGAPVSRHRITKMKEMFDDFVRLRTVENWKFWIFSLLFEPLLQSFNCSVSTASYEDLYRSTLIWVEQHCSLVELRPAVLNSLRNLCTATEILSNPSKLPEEARAAVNKKKS